MTPEEKRVLDERTNKSWGRVGGGLIFVTLGGFAIRESLKSTVPEQNQKTMAPSAPLSQSTS